nr:hypothetical protein [Schumannella luteola]
MTGYETSVTTDWGLVRYQEFQNGTVYGHRSGVFAFVGKNTIGTAYQRAGGVRGPLGPPTQEQICGPGWRCAQDFEAGAVSSSPQFGEHIVWDQIRGWWAYYGGVTGALGPAVGDLNYSSGVGGVGWWQRFEGGAVVISAAGLNQVIPAGPSLDFWLSRGPAALGWPTGPRDCVASSCAQSFTSGVVGSTVYGAQLISGGFVTEWNDRGGLNGSLGAPVSALRGSGAPDVGYAQSFVGGILTVSAAYGAVVVPWGAGQQVWSAAGEQKGFGWPSTERSCASGVCQQGFGSAIVFESKSGAFATYGGIAAVWRQQGGLNVLGAPLAGTRYSTVNGGGFAQHFDGGVITHSNGGGAQFTPYGAIIGAWYRYGAEATWMGWPAGAQSCDPSGTCTQRFQFATARSDANGGVAFTRS